MVGYSTVTFFPVVFLVVAIFAFKAIWRSMHEKPAKEEDRYSNSMQKKEYGGAWVFAIVALAAAFICSLLAMGAVMNSKI